MLEAAFLWACFSLALHKPDFTYAEIMLSAYVDLHSLHLFTYSDIMLLFPESLNKDSKTLLHIIMSIKLLTH